ncbi:hypothetical protein [Marinobacterium aestuariivivens]|uniref:Sugar ABC transporter substrate-binding protein n=1 Tax=Marinobacterium aestuariivivens TaxID=1698799 RepID=A0ABW1ZZ97_9GAMM
MKTITRMLAGAALATAISTQGYAGNVEVLHYWTSGSEAEALSVLKEMMESEGHHWTDFAVSGGGGETAMTVLKARAISGNPPRLP